MEYDRRTLLVDDTFRPIKMVTWQRAIYYIISNRGLIIDEYEDFHVRSIKLVIRVPKILQVRGKNPINEGNREVSLSNHNIYIRDNHTCAYCNHKFHKKNLSIDHITPKCQGGKNSWDNLITACTSCNNKKGGKTPEEANMPLLFYPKKMKWSPLKHLGLKETEVELFKIMFC